MNGKNNSSLTLSAGLAKQLQQQEESSARPQNKSLLESQGPPMTIEGARMRYIDRYKKYFLGFDVEKKTFVEITEMKLDFVKRCAPNFYEKRLYKYINQAVTMLLTQVGKDKQYHEQHRLFLLFLDDVAKTQPAEDTTFGDEINRIKKHNSLCKQALELRKKILDFEQMEIDLDSIGEREFEEMQVKNDENKERLLKIQMEVALLNGQDYHRYYEFKLPEEVTRGSCFSKLGEDKLQQLEILINDIVKEKNLTRSKYGKLLDPKVCENIINKLNPPKNIDQKELSKEISLAYTAFFRHQEYQERESFHNETLSIKALRPKQGKILTSIDDVPESLKEEFNESYQNFNKKFEDMLDSKHEAVLSKHATDSCDEDDDVEADIEDKHEKLIQTIKSENPMFYDRVKEERIVDYTSEEYSDELYREQAIEVEIDHTGDEDEDDDEVEYVGSSNDNNGTSVVASDSTNQGPCEMIGIVEPESKIELIEINDSD